MIALNNRVEKEALSLSADEAALGEGALGRNALIEAYYWFRAAKAHGMRNLDARLHKIRLAWLFAGRPKEEIVRSTSFTPVRNAIALALLDRDSGRNQVEATAYLEAVGFPG